MNTRLVAMDSLARAAFEELRSVERRDRSAPLLADSLAWVDLESLVPMGPWARVDVAEVSP